MDRDRYIIGSDEEFLFDRATGTTCLDWKIAIDFDRRIYAEKALAELRRLHHNHRDFLDMRVQIIRPTITWTLVKS